MVQNNNADLKRKLKQKLKLISLVSLVMPFVVSANIGKVLMAVGEVNAKRDINTGTDSLVELARGDGLLEKDVVITGKRGRAQLYMIDGAKIAVKPLSQLALEQYQYQQSNNNVVGKNDSSMTMSLIKGGFRTISGAIADDKEQSNYKVKTPIATIGIRGTDYSAFICANDCEALDGDSKVSAGVYFGVAKGSIAVQNNSGELVINKNQYAYVADANTAPIRITRPPKNLLSDTDNQGSDDKNNAQALINTNLSLPSQHQNHITPGEADPIADESLAGKEITGGITPDIVVPIDGNDETGNPIRLDDNRFDLSDTRSLLVGLNGNLVGTLSPASSIQNTDGSLTQFYALTADSQVGAEYAIDQAQTFNVGFDPNSGISWGRWGNGVMQVIGDNGETQSIDLTSSSLHWALDNASITQALPVSGSAIYSLVGNTQPTDDAGQLGLVGSAAFFVDFTNAQVATDVSLSMGQNVWQATGSASLSDNSHLFSGVYDNVTINGDNIGVGSFVGFLSQQIDTSNLPSGAALIYSLANDANAATQVINGTLIFGAPRQP